MSTTPGDVFSSLDTPSANSTTAGSSDALLASPDPFLRALDILQISISGVGVVINLATAVTLFRNGKGFSTKSRLLLQHQVSASVGCTRKVSTLGAVSRQSNQRRRDYLIAERVGEKVSLCAGASKHAFSTSRTNGGFLAIELAVSCL